MISNKDIAAGISKAMHECTGIFEESACRVMENCTAEEFEPYRDAIGQIMGIIYCDVLRPLYHRFPDLEPESMKP